MPTIINNHPTNPTTNEEVQDIYNAYTNPDTQEVDFDALAHDIESGAVVDKGFTVKDAFVAYVEGTSTAPGFFGDVPNPEDPAYAHLWEEDVVDTANYYRAHGTGAEVLAAFFGESEEADSYSEIESFLKEIEQMANNPQAIDDVNNPESDDENYWNLFTSKDAIDAVDSILEFAKNPAMAMFLYALNVQLPMSLDVSRGVIDIMDQGTDQYDEAMDLLDDAADDPEDPESQYIAQEANQIMQNVGQVFNIVQQMQQTVWQNLSTTIQAGSAIENVDFQTSQGVIANI